MREKIQPPLLVAGIARSGSSMVAGVLNICGAFGGTMSGASKVTGRGVYENDRIHDEIVAPYLESIGADKFCQYPLPNLNKLPIPPDWNQRIAEILYEDGYRGGPWMYKSSKTSLLWPIWKYAYPNAKWIIVRRRTGDIVQSCLKTSYMAAFKDFTKRELVHVNTEAEGWKWWCRQHDFRLRALFDEGVNMHVVWPERMSAGDFSQVMELAEWCRLPWKTEALTWVDQKFSKARKQSYPTSSINVSQSNYL